MKSKLLILILSIALIVVACNKTANNDGLQNENTKISITSGSEDLNKLKPFDVSLDEPQPGEWLFSNVEKSQTLTQYKKSKPVSPDSTHRTIYLLPIGEFTPIQEKIIIYTSTYLTSFFNLKTVVLPSIADTYIPSSARRIRENGSEQLLTGYILDDLQLRFPKDAIVIMAITAKDLYPGNNWNYVFGQARTKKRVGVSSIYRYSKEPLDTVNYSTCLERLIKTSSHEIGHMFTLQHCIHAVCVMNGSNNLRESDSIPNRLCSNCLSKLQWNLEFDIRDRVSKLNLFFTKHKLTNDYDLSLRDLTVLNTEQ